MGKPQQQQLQLQNLSVEQLTQLKEQLDNDLQSLGRAYDSLRVARNRFTDSKGSLEQFKQYQPKQEMLVPLTSSLFVRGELTDNQNVLVDVGTGYYIKQGVPRAQDFFAKRAAQMKSSMDGIAEAIEQKQRQQNSVIDVIQQKAQARQEARTE